MRHNKGHSTFFLPGLLAFCLTAAGLASAWTLKDSPFYSDYTDILRLPSGPILLGTQGGVFVSEDEGDSWFFSGLSSHDEQDAGDPPKFDAAEVSDGTVYIVTGNLYRADADLRGVARVAGPSNVRSIEASGDTLWVSTWETIHRSVDAGASWDEVFAVPNNYDDLVSLRRNPVTGALVCQVEKVGGLYLVRSTDGGTTWEIQQVGGAYGTMFALEYEADGTLWMGHNYQNRGYLRTSADNGQTTQISYTAPSNRQLGELTLGPAQRMAMTQGSATLVSLDGGASWIQRATDFSHPQLLFFTGGERLLAGLSGGILVSEDEGLNWSQRDEGLMGLYPFKADLAPDGTAWILSSAHLWQETPDGWVDRGVPGNIVSTPHVLRITSTGRLLVLGYGNAAPRGIYSDDGGLSWHEALGLSGSSNPQRFQNIEERDGVLYTGHNGLGLFTSSDNGATWENTNSSVRGGVAVDGNGGVWVCGDFGLSHSLDGGTTFSAITSVNAIGSPVASPVSGQVVVPGWSGAYLSSDGGASWTNVYDGAWSFLWTQNFASLNLDALGFTADGRLVMAITGQNNYVYRSETRIVETADGGITWNDVTGEMGIHHSVVREMLLSTAGPLIATSNQGLWGEWFPSTTTTVGETVQSPLRLGLNHPNPFNPRTVIPFSLPRRAPVRLMVTDLRGRRVATLVDGVLPAGTHQVEFDGRDVGSGIYLYRLESPSGIRVGKMSLIK